MSGSRSQSQSQTASPYRRKRSDTVQSSLRSPPPPSPALIGDYIDLSLWVHETTPASQPDVILNPDYWPGICNGDVVRITELSESPSDDNRRDDESEKRGYLFAVKRPGDEIRLSNTLQVSIPRGAAEVFGLRNHSNVRLTKVDGSRVRLDYIEIIFQDQYLGRSDMWRLGKQLQEKCVYAGQALDFVGSPTGKIHALYIDGKNVYAGLVTPLTKCIFRSQSAKITIFIQVCKELWEFAGDGERYTEKIVHAFLPELFRQWEAADTNHILTIVLISRVYYLDSEVDYAAGPLRKDEDGQFYKDFFKVITDLEILQEWKPTLVSLKQSFVAFQRDILLAHHYHRATVYGSNVINPSEVKLVGQISFAHEGPILEAVNLALNPMETHYVDRSLSVTGATLILITPGTGYYRVSKRLLRTTTTRLLDQGVGLDIVSLAKHPLHQTPIFSFKGFEPDAKMEQGRHGLRSVDPLWGGDMGSLDGSKKELKIFWWEPFWASMSFWDRQLDQPFRQDRFVARARMYQIEMLGLLEHDVLSSITVPNLTMNLDPIRTPTDEDPDDFQEALRADAERFDLERFALRKAPPIQARESGPSSSTATVLDPSSYRAYPMDKRPSYILHRSSTMAPRIMPIEESPKRRIYEELPPEGDEKMGTLTSHTISGSPSSSIVSSKSEGEQQQKQKEDQNDKNVAPATVGSKLVASWLFNPLRTFSSRQAPKEPQGPQPSGSHSEADATPGTANPLSREIDPASRLSASSSINTAQARTPRPMAILNTPTTRRSMLGQQQSEDELSSSARSSTFARHSPLGASPRSQRDDPMRVHNRRSTITSVNTAGPASSPSVRANPLRANLSMPYTQTSLASRWRHMFPKPRYKHEIKWKSMVTPGCLPLTTEYFPSKSELETSYDVFSYEFVIDPPEMKSFLVKSPLVEGVGIDEARKTYALVVMRGMASLRLVQGFQFIVSPRLKPKDFDRRAQGSKYFSYDDEQTPRPSGASEVFSESIEPVFLSMSNEIHRISYNGEAIQVRRYVRRMPISNPFRYECLVWPKDGVGYTELQTSFITNGLENYGWNRLDMLIAGYEHQFNESLRYWRTRFIVIPTLEAPPPTTGASGERLNDEETRLIGSDKLSEIWSRLRWTQASERGSVHQPVRFLPTYLSPTASVVDDHLVSQLEQIMASGPLQKKMKSEREISEMSLASIAKLMREDPGLQIKDHKWHTSVYEDSFTGYEFASWLCREFRDVSTRDQAQEWGIKLHDQGLFEHCRRKHGFLDGHYFYRLRNEYAIPRTPRSSKGWGFRSVNRHVSAEEKEGKALGFYPGGIKSGLTNKRRSKRLVLSQTMVMDMDPSKKSDQAECVILHHDLIHNPANVFHFELQWLGTTARCIEEQLRAWSSRIERYGLKLVEAYVLQIADIRDRNPFQSCFPVRLSVPPPVIPDMEKRLQWAAQEAHGSELEKSNAAAPARYYFEYALLAKFGFILDIEATDLYPSSVDVFYSYRRSNFNHSQFVHRTGVAFVQVLGGAEGFLFLTNRLMTPARASFPTAGGSGGGNGGGVGSKGRIRPIDSADELRLQMDKFCQDREALTCWYDEVIATLPIVPEDPPPLSI